jgi:hypothetical protein
VLERDIYDNFLFFRHVARISTYAKTHADAGECSIHSNHG